MASSTSADLGHPSCRPRLRPWHARRASEPASRWARLGERAKGRRCCVRECARIARRSIGGQVLIGKHFQGLLDQCQSRLGRHAGRTVPRSRRACGSRSAPSCAGNRPRTRHRGRRRHAAPRRARPARTPLRWIHHPWQRRRPRRAALPRASLLRGARSPSTATFIGTSSLRPPAAPRSATTRGAAPSSNGGSAATARSSKGIPRPPAERCASECWS